MNGINKNDGCLRLALNDSSFLDSGNKKGLRVSMALEVYVLGKREINFSALSMEARIEPLLPLFLFEKKTIPKIVCQAICTGYVHSLRRILVFCEI